jgi:hypothetical protein
MRDVEYGGAASSGLRLADLDVSDIISDFGNVERSVDYDRGFFIPGAHSFGLIDSDDVRTAWTRNAIDTRGDLMPGSRLLCGKYYDVYIVVSDPDTCEDTGFLIYTGKINGRDHDKDGGKINISSYDLFSGLSDFKFSQEVALSDIYNLASSGRSAQTMLLYGTNKRIHPYAEDTMGKAIQIFHAAPSLTSGASFDFSTSVIPVINDIETDISLYSAGTLKIWVRWSGNYYYLNPAQISASTVSISRTSANGYKIVFSFAADNVTIYDNTDTAVGYFASKAGYILFYTGGATVSTTMYMDIRSKISSIGGAATISNPVAVMYDVLRLAGLQSYADYSAWDSGDTSYTWDSTAKYFEDISSNGIMMRVDKEKSVQEIISEICRVCGVSVYCGAPQNANITSGTITADRRFKMALVRDYAAATDIPRYAVYATNSNAHNVRYSEKNTKQYNVVSMPFATEYEEPSYVTEQNYDYYSETKNTLEIKSDFVWWYNTTTLARDAATRYAAIYGKPTETISFSTDFSGALHSAGEFASLYDAKTGETAILRIERQGIDLDNGTVNITGKVLFSDRSAVVDEVETDWVEVGSATGTDLIETGSAGTGTYNEQGV